MTAARPLPPDLGAVGPVVLDVLADQCGVIARRQVLATGLGGSDIARLVRRRIWAPVHPGVYVDHTGPLTWQQRAWAAVLLSWPAALSHQSALRAAEGPGRRERDEGVIHVAVNRGRHLVAPAGVVIHRLSRFERRALWTTGPPRMRYEEAALDVAAGAPSDFAALGVLAEACQSRRTTATRMLESLDQRDRIGRRDWLAGVLADVAEGVCSVLEHGYLTRVERAHGLPRAWRQRRAEATLGITYRDVEYDDLVLELDGRLFHDTTRQRDRDMDRDLDSAVDGHTTIRLSYGQVFDRPCHTARRIAVLLRQRGWRRAPRPCGDDCSLRG
ncbi:type IV toxin-antitoxin system AbiEi family antitoxin domain-containing protein [Nocardioides sp.]|uniref:type IV toxin-antitoxin system AbiEi family antitoxin domain-containing protein n=1 Tax=Nocardioides sp. TaxID=35761 RepID=UPI0027344EE9|nr:type IV toxin-antitoxin system AbiEi family antitoxin domain-containing protein [Nocardioides sp.]MDP3889981.1 type IV toxin-antitoxin system AbiEi family antitoxin domain-containing protein [Nocardioides sp.]